MDILNSILYLVPDAKFCIWENDYSTIQWNPTNTKPCPSLSEIMELDQSLVAKFANDRRELERKASRDLEASTNLTILSNYNLYKADNPDKSLSEYLDYLENIATT